MTFVNFNFSEEYGIYGILRDGRTVDCIVVPTRHVFCLEVVIRMGPALAC